MSVKITGSVPSDRFSLIARKAVVDYWNASKTLTKKHGGIDIKSVRIVWQVKAAQNAKAVMCSAVPEDDRLLFEATWLGDEGKLVLDIYTRSGSCEYRAESTGIKVTVERANG